MFNCKLIKAQLCLKAYATANYLQYILRLLKYLIWFQPKLITIRSCYCATLWSTASRGKDIYIPQYSFTSMKFQRFLNSTNSTWSQKRCNREFKFWLSSIWIPVLNISLKKKNSSWSAFTALAILGADYLSIRLGASVEVDSKRDTRVRYFIFWSWGSIEIFFCLFFIFGQLKNTTGRIDLPPILKTGVVVNFESSHGLVSVQLNTKTLNRIRDDKKMSKPSSLTLPNAFPLKLVAPIPEVDIFDVFRNGFFWGKFESQFKKK